MLDFAPPPIRVADPPKHERPTPQRIAVEGDDAGRAPRLAAAALTLLCVVAVVGGASTNVSGLQALGASVFFCIAVGSPLPALVRRLSLASFVLASVAASLTTTLLVGFAMAETGFWHPVGAFAVLAVVSVALHGYALRSRRDATRLDRAVVIARVRAAAFPLGASALGLALVVSACLSHAGSYAGRYGAFGRLGPLWYAGLLLLVAAVALSARHGARWAAGLTVVAFATALALTPALLYEYPTVTSAARHVGVTQVIRHFGHVELSQGIYHRWPGLFAGSGMIWDVGDVTNPLAWARWAPVLIDPASALGVFVLARRVLVTRTSSVSDFRLWAIAAVFAVTNVLGNAYFSPQSICFVLALAVLALAVPTEASLAGRGRALRLGALTVVAFAITVTHQLTPYLILLTLLVLVLFRLVRPWQVLLLVGVPALGWAAINYKVLSQYINLAALGNAAGNAAPPNHGGHLGYAHLTDVAIYLPMALFVVVGAVATVVALRRRTRLDWALFVCAAGQALLFLGNNYGNEALFRAALFALPWLCMLLARGTFRPRRARAVAFGAALLVGTAVFAIGTYGMDWYRVIRPGTVTAVERLESTAPPGSVVLMTGSGNAIPGRLTERSPDVQYIARDTLRSLPVDKGYDARRDVLDMTTVFTRLGTVPQLGRVPAYYALISTSIGAYDDLYGIQRYSHFVQLRSAMAASGYWQPVYRSKSATLYRLDIAAFRAARASDGR